MITPGDGGMGPGRLGPMYPQLALRVAIVGGLTLALFAIIFFRLWVLQVLTGNQYVREAAAVSSREISVGAPRGEIIDRNGTVLVGSKQSPAIQISPDSLPVKIAAYKDQLSTPPAADQAIYDKISKLLGISNRSKSCSYKLWKGPKEQTKHARLTPVACTVAQDVAQSPFANATIKTNVSTDVQAYLAERQAQYPGVVSTEVYTRSYPENTLAAQLFGTVRPITAAEIKEKEFKGIPETDSVGQSGLEYEYNQYLQGTDGYEKVKVNAAGTFEGYEKGKAATEGDNLQLSLDANLQRVGEESLQKSMNENGGDGGAFVALDPENGQVYAMGSLPTYNPTVFTRPITEKQYQQEFGQNSGDPLINRAIYSAVPTGSTFKVITATAALESGAVTPSYSYDDSTGKYCIPGSDPNVAGDCPQNSGGTRYYGVDLNKAIQDSVDTYFYRLGYLMYSAKGNGGALQSWAAKFGIGQSTGVDIPGASAGSMPGPKLTAELNKAQLACEKKYGKRYTAKPSLCQYSDDAVWTPGDNVHAAVGQGGDEVTPLQLALVYSAIANGGTLVTPHVGLDVQTASGSILDRIDPSSKRKLGINPIYLGDIQQGLYDAANVSGGTSASVMSNFKYKVYGKTGTAQTGETSVSAASGADSSWYACYVPRSETSKPIAIVVWVQKGGFGAVAAAPVARQMLSQWFLGKPGAYVAGSSKDQ
jgi:penicillin-binding protein 2